MKNTMFCSVLMIFGLPLFASERVVPTQAYVAQKFLAERLKVDVLEINQAYDLDWEYLVTTEEDQPITFKFTGLSQTCWVEVASDSLRVLDSNCHPSQGVQFNQSPGCGVYDGNFITLSAPQDEVSCRRVAESRGLLDQTVMSYCTAGSSVDIVQASFVEVCKKAFRDLRRRKS